MFMPSTASAGSAGHGHSCPLLQSRPRLPSTVHLSAHVQVSRRSDDFVKHVQKRLKTGFFNGYRAVSQSGAQVPGSAQAAASGTFRQLHPAASPFKTGRLQVSQLHSLYYEVYGNPNGQPAVVFHGGPGAGCYANHARFFDLSHYKVVLVDQRGCGKSQPLGCLEDNNTAALIGDFEALRESLGIERWLLFGGSWGVALSLAYAQAHSHRVSGIILRGICLMRPSEIQWMYGGGAGNLAPSAWASFTADLGKRELKNPLAAYHKRLTSPKDAQQRDAAARAWMGWEMGIGFGLSTTLQRWNGQAWDKAGAQPAAPPSPGPSANVGAASAAAAASSPSAGASSPSTGNGAAKFSSSSSSSPPPPPGSISGSVAQAMLECHYSFNNAFLEDTPLLEGLDSIRHIPCIAVQGRLDFVCPPRTAYDLHLAWPEMELLIVPGAGHSMYNPGIQDQLLQATDRMRHLAKNSNSQQRQPTQRARELASK
ncbi:hypothetical protein WJX84_008817 [Apatococcus fuscideae]|uniref:prolyl aminopeptidase n=1 Tax=Apatococcus fuscideae TaxID=2026836 RepID=A0AAW1SMB5_9CHLO